LRLYIFKVSGIDFTKLRHVTYHTVCIITYVQLLGHRSLKIWEGKTAKILRNLRQLLTFTANIWETCPDIENGKQTWSRAIAGKFSKKVITLVHEQKSY